MFDTELSAGDYGVVRADFNAGAAVGAGFGVDFVNLIALADGLDRAFRHAGSAGNAVICDFVSHCISPLIFAGRAVAALFRFRAVISINDALILSIPGEQECFAADFAVRRAQRPIFMWMRSPFFPPLSEDSIPLTVWPMKALTKGFTGRNFPSIQTRTSLRETFLRYLS